MNPIEKQDIQCCASSFELADQFKRTSFLITGATGLIGSSLIHLLLAIDKGL